MLKIWFHVNLQNVLNKIKYYYHYFTTRSQISKMWPRMDNISLNMFFLKTICNPIGGTHTSNCN
jgi:hypothetical protein